MQLFVSVMLIAAATLIAFLLAAPLPGGAPVVQEELPPDWTH